jgi:thioredoxin reductase
VLEVESQKATYKARRVILAAGKAGNPRKAGVDGEVENAARIAHRLLDPDDYQNQRVAIYGGGDVALEAALTLCEHNEVTLVTIDKKFVYPKKRNVDKLTVGIDVMAFAKNQEPFDNSNSACIQCGICVDVCPMDVLSFTTEDESKVAAKVVA